MIHVKKFFLSWFTIGVVAGAALFNTYAALNEVPEPYTDVELVQVAWMGDDVHLSANFIKNDECVFEELKIFVQTKDGTWRTLPYFDIDGQPDGDRLEGQQTLDLGIANVGHLRENVAVLEMRTRHNCRVGDSFVKNDKVFVHVEVDEIN